ncbi:AAA-ATPase ASD, mitochondrial-like [Abrus precatorius]|uniref:AAA-ATPase ASD, mitochondrial-like n=1 Tax=Abrus precatorius TaxID=3816 RepID=A0A8B8LSG0_ABRPR|nr:AAA-ATPase ASD, mitochondrial-like [Abrus precatorius]
MHQMWTQLGSLMATSMFIYTIFMRLFPPPLQARLRKYTHKLTSFVYPYIRITFHEFTGERLMRSEAYNAIQTYLSEHSSKQATKLKAELVKVKDTHTPLVLSMDDNEEIIEEFQGVKLWWSSYKITPKTQSFSFHPASDERRYFKLTFHKRYRSLITECYLKHVLEEAKAIEMKNRQLKLYTNSKTRWSHVVFEHPATFETLAMNPTKKEDVINDLVKFKSGRSYYAKIGKAWKRGYLLYGPPGTGKSTMIAAMANFMNYDVYDLELTAVKDNSDLRRLLINTCSKSVIVIEDIDCSLDLTGQRKKKKDGKERKGCVKRGDRDDDDDDDNEKGSKVTLSGLLNVIDGIWSGCGGERIVVFTTNFVEKLDPALIRRGRMDKHIELSYCCYEAFKVLAKNYLDVEFHHLFPRIEKLLEETKMTPADVAENLMPKSLNEEVDTSLLNLIHALEMSKEDAERKKEETEKEQFNVQENALSENHGEEMEDNGVII